MKKKWFSFIEIIVSLIIIWILSTFASITVTNWLKKSRDAKRLWDLNVISSSLENYYFKNKEYPYPSEYIKITFSWNTLWYQWELKNNLIKKLNLKSTPTDPLSNLSYTYSITNNKNNFQLFTFLEENKQLSFKKGKRAYAKDFNYKNMYPTVKGNNIWTFLETNSLEPIEKYFSGSYTKDIKTYNTWFNVVFEDNFSISGSWKQLLTKIENFRNNISNIDDRLNLYLKFNKWIWEEIEWVSKNNLKWTLSWNIIWSEWIEEKWLFKESWIWKAIINHHTGISLTWNTSISLWLRPLEKPSTKVNLLKKWDNYWINYKTNWNIEVYLNSTNLTWNIKLHRRNHIVLNYKDEKLNLFKNWDIIKTTSFSWLNKNTENLYLLSWNYKGVIDEVRIYKWNIYKDSIDSIYKSSK